MKEEYARKLLKIIQLQEEYGDELEIAQSAVNIIERRLKEKQGSFNNADLVEALLIDFKQKRSRENLYFRTLTSNNDVLIEFLTEEWKDWLHRGNGDKKEFIKYFRSELDIGIYRMEKLMSSVDYITKQDLQYPKGLF